MRLLLLLLSASAPVAKTSNKPAPARHPVARIQRHARRKRDGCAAADLVANGMGG